MRSRVLSSQIGLPGGLLATEVGAVEKPFDSSDEYELPNECPYGEVGDASDTHDIDPFPPLLRLCERDLLRPARLGDEPIRCKPLSSRCLPLDFGFSIVMASLGGVWGGDERISFACSTTTESMDSGSIVEVMVGR